MDCLIIGAGICDSHFIKEYGAKYPDAFVVGVDGGYKSALAAGLHVNLFVGDGDSLGDELVGSEVLTLPEEKDETDMQVAVDECLSRGFDRLHLLGATGGRLDHFLANLGLLERITEKGGQGLIADSKNIIRLYPGCPLEITKSSFKYVSVLPLDECCSGINLVGFKYPLTNATVCRHQPLAVSNELVGETAVIEIKKGRALVMFTRD